VGLALSLSDLLVGIRDDSSSLSSSSSISLPGIEGCIEDSVEDISWYVSWFWTGGTSIDIEGFRDISSSLSSNSRRSSILESSTGYSSSSNIVISLTVRIAVFSGI
jgi:hypothetical protein